MGLQPLLTANNCVLVPCKKIFPFFRLYSKGGSPSALGDSCKGQTSFWRDLLLLRKSVFSRPGAANIFPSRRPSFAVLNAAAELFNCVSVRGPSSKGK